MLFNSDLLNSAQKQPFQAGLVKIQALDCNDTVQRATKFMREHLKMPAVTADVNPPLTGEARDDTDKVPQSMLYDLLQQMVPRVWSVIGATAGQVF